jgi:L-asparaginase II
VHEVHGVVVGLEGGIEQRFGDPDRAAFWRSSMKPFQTLPLLVDGAADHFAFTPEELALCSASHHGTVDHVGRVADLLGRIGLDADALACGPHRPFDEEAARALERASRAPERLHNNCSGKHTGMLALALYHGWAVEGYERYEHPVQARIRSELRGWLKTDPEGLVWAPDGCGVPTPSLSLRGMAHAYARLARAGNGAPLSVVSAMIDHPHLTSGSKTLSARLTRSTDGRVLAKGGAEGVFCVAGLDTGWAAAIKVNDGTTRAVAPALLAVLERLELLAPAELEVLADLRRPPVYNTLCDVVGYLEAVAEPEIGTMDPVE